MTPLEITVMQELLKKLIEECNDFPIRELGSCGRSQNDRAENIINSFTYIGRDLFSLFGKYQPYLEAQDLQLLEQYRSMSATVTNPMNILQQVKSYIKNRPGKGTGSACILLYGVDEDIKSIRSISVQLLRIITDKILPYSERQFKVQDISICADVLKKYPNIRIVDENGQKVLMGYRMEPIALGDQTSLAMKIIKNVLGMHATPQRADILIQIFGGYEPKRGPKNTTDSNIAMADIKTKVDSANREIKKRNSITEQTISYKKVPPYEVILSLV